MAQKRATVYGRQSPISLQEGLALESGGNLLHGMQNFVLQKAVKNTTGSDALVNSALDRFTIPQGRSRRGARRVHSFLPNLRHCCKRATRGLLLSPIQGANTGISNAGPGILPNAPALPGSPLGTPFYKCSTRYRSAWSLLGKRSSRAQTRCS